MRAYVYILTNRRNGALYTGVTAELPARMMQHRAGAGSKFCAQYGIDRLIYVEEYPTLIEAIAREKAIEQWRRAWKIALIEAANPEWRDLFFDLNGAAEGRRHELGPRFRGDDGWG